MKSVNRNRMRRFTCLLYGQLVGLLLALPGIALAEPVPLPASVRSGNPYLDPTPFDPDVLKPDNLPPAAITSATISLTGLTPPSLWWMKQQYAFRDPSGSKLIENWIAFPLQPNKPGRVDVVVNRQLWSLLDYLQRYTFVNEFGTAAGDFGYNVRFFDSNANFLAAYTCRLHLPVSSGLPISSAYARSYEALNCQTDLDSGGRSSLRGRSMITP
jgi:hypothetical protein